MSLLAAAVVLAVSALVAGAGVRAPLRTVPKLPPLAAKLAQPRYVLLVITESVRLDGVCLEHQADCLLTPFTNRIAASRLPLFDVRANASSTALSVGVLWSGLLPTQMREVIRSAPTVFDYAHAAGYDTAYWSSQSLMFTNSPAFFAALPLSRRCVGADLEPPLDDAGADDTLLTARVARELPELREPWFAVVQYANTHYPYRTRGAEPFQPSSESHDSESNAQFKNHYQNAIYAQDRTIADMLRSLRSTATGERTVVIYTSDHGEAFREHGQLGHTTSIFEEELRVPAWIDAPPQALTEAERAAFAAARDQPVWHLDFAPTILDLLGIWDLPAMTGFRARMLGTSLLQPTRTHAILPLTNCAEMWGCGFRNWGVIRDSMKLEAREFDLDWRCFDVGADPREQHDLGAAACRDLRDAAHGFFGRLPKDTPPMRGLSPAGGNSQ